jgi:hypothetical protein
MLRLKEEQAMKRMDKRRREGRGVRGDEVRRQGE